MSLSTAACSVLRPARKAHVFRLQYENVDVCTGEILHDILKLSEKYKMQEKIVVSLIQRLINPTKHIFR